MITTPPSVDVKDLIVNSGQGVFGSTVFIGKTPDSPHACITITDTGGFSPDSNMVYEYPTVQVRVRGDIGDYLGTWGKAQSIKTLLHNYAEKTAQSDGSRTICVWAMGDILFLDYDETNRPTFSVNFRIHRTG